jgi:hypothetical protein
MDNKFDGEKHIIVPFLVGSFVAICILKSL